MFNILNPGKQFKQDFNKKIEATYTENDVNLAATLIQDIGTTVVDPKTIKMMGDDYKAIAQRLFMAQVSLIERLPKPEIYQAITWSLWEFERKHEIAKAVFELDNGKAIYQSLLHEIISVYEAMIDNGDYKERFSTPLYNMAKIQENQILLAQPPEQYKIFFNRILEIEKSFFPLTGEQGNVPSSGELLQVIQNDDVIKALGTEYPDKAKMVLAMFKSKRDKFKSSDQEYKVLNKNITSLVSNEELTSFIDRKVLEQQGLLSLTGNSHNGNLISNLLVAQHFLENKNQTTKSEFLKEIESQIYKRKDTITNHTDMLSDFKDIDMIVIYTKVNDIKALKTAHANINNNKKLRSEPLPEMFRTKNPEWF